MWPWDDSRAIYPDDETWWQRRRRRWVKAWRDTESGLRSVLSLGRHPALSPVRSAVQPALVCLAIAAVAALAVARILHDRGMAVDDAYILAKYARNLGDGLGLRWNAGSPPCEGFTSTVFVALLAACGKLGAGPLGAAAALSAAAVVGTVGLLIAAARPRSAWFAAAAIPAFWYATDLGTVIHASRGLETSVFCFVAVALVAATGWATRLSSGRRGAFVAIAIVSFLVVLTRPDGLLVVAACWIVAAAVARSERLPLRELAPGATLLVGLGVAYVGWKLLYFGDVVPTAYYVKANLPGWNGAGATAEFASAYWGVLLCATLASVAAWALFALAPDGVRRAVPAECLVFVVVAVPWTVHSCSTLHEMGFHHRFCWPLVPLAGLATTHALRRIGAGLADDPGAALRRMMVGCGLLGVAAFVRYEDCAGALGSLDDARPSDPVVASFERLGRAIAAAGLGERAALICPAAGATPYFSGARHVDPYGLASREFSLRVPEDERLRLIQTIPFDVRVTIFPPASPGATDLGGDAASTTPYVRRVLEMASDIVRRGIISDPERWPLVVHDQMRMLRDRATLVGEVRHTDAAGHSRFFVYVAKGSAHRDALLAALTSRIDIPASEVK